MTFDRSHVLKVFSLYTSELNDVAKWLSVARERPDENTTLYVKRVLQAAKDAGKLDELAELVDQFHAARSR